MSMASETLCLSGIARKLSNTTGCDACCGLFCHSRRQLFANFSEINQRMFLIVHLFHHRDIPLAPQRYSQLLDS
jgi:hypothetical protein